MGFGRERLDLAPTPANIRYAERLRAEILGKVERGTFVLSEYFPNSPRVTRDAPSMKFRAMALEWLDSKKPEVQHSTAHHYQQTLDSYHFEEWNDKAVAAFDFRTTKQMLAKLPAHPKTFNNIATVVRQVFEYGYRAKLLREPVHELVTMRKRQQPEPDPFPLAEVEALLLCFPDGKARDYYEFAFFSGLRPSEQIALHRTKVDLRRGLVRVDEALTRGQVKGTKTGNTRDVELPARALAALQRQIEREPHGKRVFSDNDGQPLETTDTPLNQWWRPAIKASGLRVRDARQTRHTFATICLMGGLTPAWAAAQMGHSVEMFFRVYSKWIDGADQGAERRKLDAFLGGGAGVKTGTKTGTTGPN